MAQTKSRQLNYRPFTGLIIRETSTFGSTQGKRQEPLGLPEQKMREVMIICAKGMSFKPEASESKSPISSVAGDKKKSFFFFF